MNYFKLLTKLIPPSVKGFILSKIRILNTNLKKPKMYYGYKNINGEWRSSTRISDTVFMYHPERISISNNVFIWHYSILDGTGGLEIGEGSQIGAWVGIFTHSSHIAIRIYGNHYQEIPEELKKGYPIDKVSLGKYVFIGAGSKILPGVNIGDGALISAGTIVNKDIDSFQIATGNPAQIIGDTRTMDQKYLGDHQLKQWYLEWQKS
jgi:acetyltransferase-like isoleucine patch superfamily enzyme